MTYFARNLKLIRKIEKKSHFLFGPRLTGKSSMIQHQCHKMPLIDLLESDTFIRLSQRPSLLRELIPADAKTVVIDEIQKLPVLLDEVHLLIERRKINFLLTGSSARKLKRQGVNMLGGRARSLNLYPLVSTEIGAQFNIHRAINYGLLPSVYLSSEPDLDLASYVNDYLQLEIAAEGLSKSLPAFSRFLEIAATTNGEVLNYQNIANDSQVPHSTVTEYYQVLVDTLVGSRLSCWQQTTKRKPIAKDKFYFFDTGVVRQILGVNEIKQRSPHWGVFFEAFIHHELQSYCSYNQPKRLHFWRSQTSHYEVDFILNDEIAIEVKAKEAVSKKDCRGIHALMEENMLRKFYVVSFEAQKRHLENGIVILPWQTFLKYLWQDDL